MPLIDLKTDLKSLRYGKDTLGGGDSGQPYIQKSIPENFNNLGSSKDFLLRGGINGLSDAVTDVSRLTQMFFDLKSPNGLLFVSKQQLLSRTAVRTQTSGVLNDHVYNPLNTLAQTGVNILGGHLNKQGKDPFELTGAYSNNDKLYGVRVKTDQPVNENRLVQIYEAIKNNAAVSTKDGFTYAFGPNIISYNGGPGSDIGIGKTNIQFAVGARTGKQNKLAEGDETQKAIFLGQNFKPTKQEDFRLKLRTATGQKIVTQDGSSIISRAPEYGLTSPKNLENRTNLGNPGERGNIISYTAGKQNLVGNYEPTDKINALPIYRSEYVTQDEIKNDLVKFRIASIDNDAPNFKTFMHFRALLGSMSDSYSSTWAGTKYLGRAEDFYTYTGFNRTISLSWTIVAQSKLELIPMYKKLNYLASTMAPDYSKFGYMRGNLSQLTIGGYIYEQPGFFTQLDYTVPDDTTWEIGINDQGGFDGQVKEMPHRIEVQASFTPIHNFVPTKMKLPKYQSTASLKDINEYGNEKYIALANGGSDSNSNYNVYDTSNALTDFQAAEARKKAAADSKAASIAAAKAAANLSITSGDDITNGLTELNL